jgi:hypothetical protein
VGLQTLENKVLSWSIIGKSAPILAEITIRKSQERIFERRSGAASMLLEAGRLWTRQGWKEQPLPYGTRPRLVMVHISGEAVRKQTRQIEVGDSMRDFLKILALRQV